MILKNYLIICANNAKVFHYRNPEKRVEGPEFGIMHILNRAYVVCKNSEPGSLERRLLRRFIYYKLFRYVLQIHTKYGRQRLQGAWFASKYAMKLSKSQRNTEIQKLYKNMQELY